jgi:hypothetical protein
MSDHGPETDQAATIRADPAKDQSAARKSVLLRLDPAVYRALAQWANDELRSVNGQLEMVLREGLSRAGRLPRGLKPPRKPGRPPTAAPEDSPPQASR